MSGNQGPRAFNCAGTPEQITPDLDRLAAACGAAGLSGKRHLAASAAPRKWHSCWRANEPGKGTF